MTKFSGRGSTFSCCSTARPCIRLIGEFVVTQLFKRCTPYGVGDGTRGTEDGEVYLNGDVAGQPELAYGLANAQSSGEA